LSLFAKERLSDPLLFSKERQKEQKSEKIWIRKKPGLRQNGIALPGQRVIKGTDN